MNEMGCMAPVCECEHLVTRVPLCFPLPYLVSLGNLFGECRAFPRDSAAFSSRRLAEAYQHSNTLLGCVLRPLHRHAPTHLRAVPDDGGVPALFRN